MRFSLWCDASLPWDRLLAEALHAEATGWDGLWLADHFLPAAGGTANSPDECCSYLAALAAAVPRVRLGPLVLGNTYRHPAVVAKQATTIDRISGGRMVLGLGAGWQENEHRAFGIELPPVGRRLDMFEEACELIKRLTTSDDEVTFTGATYQLEQAYLAPRPAQAAIPLLVGGGGEHRTLRIAARWADEWNTWGLPDHLRQKMAVLDRRCEEVGRDPATIARSAQVVVAFEGDDIPPPRPGLAFLQATPAQLTDLMGAYAEAGVQEFIVRDSLALGGSFDNLDRFLAEVAAPWRDPG